MSTKGEWTIGYGNHGNGGFAEWYTIESNEEVIAEVARGSRLDEEDKANARLIARAPELLEVLKDAEGYISKHPDLNILHKRMVLAIAKAEK